MSSILSECVDTHVVGLRSFGVRWLRSCRRRDWTEDRRLETEDRRMIAGRWPSFPSSSRANGATSATIFASSSMNWPRPGTAVLVQFRAPAAPSSTSSRPTRPSSWWWMRPACRPRRCGCCFARASSWSRARRWRTRPPASLTYHLVERDFGRFARVVRVDGAFDIDRASATLRAGELTVVLPKRIERRGQAHRVPVRMPGESPG